MISTPVKLSPPWITLLIRLKVFFEQDPEIKIEYINDPPTVKLFVENEKKAEALAALLPYQINVGFTLKIIVIPANTTLFLDKLLLIKKISIKMMLIHQTIYLIQHLKEIQLFGKQLLLKDFSIIDLLLQNLNLKLFNFTMIIQAIYMAT